MPSTISSTPSSRTPPRWAARRGGSPDLVGIFNLFRQVGDPPRTRSVTPSTPGGGFPQPDRAPRSTSRRARGGPSASSRSTRSWARPWWGGQQRSCPTCSMASTTPPRSGRSTSSRRRPVLSSREPTSRTRPVSKPRSPRRRLRPSRPSGSATAARTTTRPEPGTSLCRPGPRRRSIRSRWSSTSRWSASTSASRRWPPSRRSRRAPATATSTR